MQMTFRFTVYLILVADVEIFRGYTLLSRQIISFEIESQSKKVYLVCNCAIQLTTCAVTDGGETNPGFVSFCSLDCSCVIILRC